MSFMLLLWVLSTTWDLGYGYGYGLTSFYGGFVLCIFFFILSFVIDEPIKLTFFFFFQSPLWLYGIVSESLRSQGCANSQGFFRTLIGPLLSQ